MDLPGDRRLGITLRALRRAAGMTQEELAERAGISGRTVSDVERGVRDTVHGDTARRLSCALGLTDESRVAFETLAQGRLDEPAIPVTGLPQVPTPLVGRAGEVTAVTEALASPGVRLLTLTGPGGIGKTRLAIQAAVQVRDRFPGGVYFVALGEVGDAGLVAAEIAKAVGVAETGGPDLQAALTERLTGSGTLVVLDTFEHLTAAVPLIYTIMLGSNDVTFLVTSRSALRLRGEQQFPVPPLAWPAGADEVRPADIARWPATALFWDRALAVRPDLALDPPAAVLVADICRKLDGLPLAIELAAARVRHLTLGAVRDQLRDRLRLLVGGPHDLPRRQRAIRDTVAWSYGLLDQGQARLFRRLSVFAGGWDLESVGQVCGPAEEIGDPLEGVSALVDQSLVVLDRHHPGGRYEMLDIIREYATDRLAQAGETEQVTRRHVLHHLEIAEEAGPNLVRSGQRQRFGRLDANRGNFRRAMAWAVDHGETVIALRYTAALWRYWRQLGDLTEGRRWNDTALSMSGEVPPSLRAKAVGAAVALAFPQGDYARLTELAAEAVDLASRSNDPMDMRNALTVRGFVAIGQGRYADALDAFGQCVEICQQLGPSWQAATSRLNLGVALMYCDRPEEADAVFEEGLGLYRELGDDIFAARMINQRAQVALARQDANRADALAREALAGFWEHEEPQGIAEGLETLAAVAAVRSDHDRAATLGGAAAAIRERTALRQLPDLIVGARLMAGARREADPEQWRAGWDKGTGLDPGAAVAYALDWAE